MTTGKIRGIIPVAKNHISDFAVNIDSRREEILSAVLNAKKFPISFYSDNPELDHKQIGKMLLCRNKSGEIGISIEKDKSLIWFYLRHQ